MCDNVKEFIKRNQALISSVYEITLGSGEEIIYILYNASGLIDLELTIGIKDTEVRLLPMSIGPEQELLNQVGEYVKI